MRPSHPEKSVLDHDEQIGVLTSAVDAKDAYTALHSRRVALLARALAIACGLSEEESDRVYLAGLLHDIGKIHLPASLLQKPGGLTDAEFAAIKSHAEMGAGILEDFPEFADLISAVLHHHERYDGRGYPHQLSGNEIPFAARILCLADSLDAMTSNRPYRQPLSIESALREISICAGQQFDPEISTHLLKIPSAQLQTLLAA